MLRQMARAASGWDRTLVQEAGALAAERLVDEVPGFAKALIAEHHAAGRKVVMATTSPFDLVRPLADALGIDDVIATRYGEADGRYDGSIDGFFVWGPGKLAAVPGYVSAGKTGTARIAQNIDAEDGYLNEQGRYEYQASFVGMVNGADLSIIVTLEDPRTSIFGGDVAAPVFAHLAATALRRYEVPPPALLGSTSHDVPELSASAREVDGADVASTTTTAQG